MLHLAAAIWDSCENVETIKFLAIWQWNEQLRYGLSVWHGVEVNWNVCARACTCGARRAQQNKKKRKKKEKHTRERVTVYFASVYNIYVEHCYRSLQHSLSLSLTSSVDIERLIYCVVCTSLFISLFRCRSTLQLILSIRPTGIVVPMMVAQPHSIRQPKTQQHSTRLLPSLWLACYRSVINCLLLNLTMVSKYLYILFSCVCVCVVWSACMFGMPVIINSMHGFICLPEGFHCRFSHTLTHLLTQSVYSLWPNWLATVVVTRAEECHMIK